MPSAADGSATRPAWSKSIRIPAMIDASCTRTASSATRRRSSRTAGMGRRPATPSAMVSVESVVTTRRSRHERCQRRCAQRLDADHLDLGCQRLQRMTHAGGQRPAAESDQDGVERLCGVRQFQADGRRALTGLDVRTVFDQPDAFVPRDGRRALASQLVVAVHQLQPGAQRADAVELGHGREAGRHDAHLDPPAATGPGEGLAEIARAGADRGSRAVAGQQVRDHLGAAALEAAHRVRRFELDAHRTPELGLQRLAAVQRGVEKDRVDHPASRPDPSSVETRLLHEAAAW